MTEPVKRCSTTRWFGSLLAVGWILLAGFAAAAQELPASIHLERDGINRVTIDCGDSVAVVYAPPKADSGSEDPDSFDCLFLTHSRRDILAPAEAIAETAGQVIAPAAEQDWFSKPQDFWDAYARLRFNDYAQRTTKVRASPLRVTRFVKQGDAIDCGNVRFAVLETPGFTAGAVTYAVELDGKRIGFVGDLILGDGQIFDLYSFQDAIHEAKIRGYHGYGGRLAELVRSLRKLRDQQFDLLIPARGPLIREPSETIDRLIGRIESLIRNYLSTSALHWYFKADNMTLVGRRVLGADASVELMRFAEHAPAPEWVWSFATTRLILSNSGRAFMLDCWNPSALDAVQSLLDEGQIKAIDGIFVTHHHDDHTAMVQKAARQFDCPVFCLRQYQDVLQNPGAYHLPCVSANAIEPLRVMDDGDQIDWEEFRFTFHFFPGQTLYHGALHVQPQREPSILFVGDSFAPSGFDDYCVQNRNLLHEDSGYLLCLKVLRRYGPKQWLINQHIPQVFRFTNEELDYLESRYRQRIAIQRELYFWDDPNFGVDENWASCYPYAQSVAPGKMSRIEIRITNHSPTDRDFEVGLHGFEIRDRSPASEDRVQQTHVKSGQSGSVVFQVEVPHSVGVHLLTADIKSAGIELEQWVEGMVIVELNEDDELRR